MFQSKYNKILTVILVIVIIAIVALLGFLGYDYYKRYVSQKDQESIVEEFQSEVASLNESQDEGSTEVEDIDTSNLGTQTNQDETTSTTNRTQIIKTYKGFPMAGTLEAPKTGYKYPVLSTVSNESLEESVAILTGAGLNQVGNTVIYGHNYRNGTAFAKNDKLVVGDKIYITDLEGNRLSYTIYEKSIKEANDASFYTRDTNGKAEITLSTCTNDGKRRIVIFAAAD